jgi:predicted nucleic acid-binding Zn ribbon protein
MSDKPLRKCPKCGGKLEKLLPQTLNLIFKGSGFYITDYKNKGQRQPDSKPGHKSKPDKAGRDSGSGSDD